MNQGNEKDSARSEYIDQQINHYDDVARRLNSGEFRTREFYQHRLAQVYRSRIPPGCRVIEVGCGQGDLIASLRPSFGVGVDLSWEMIRIARIRHPQIQFAYSDIQDFITEEKFDFIVLSDLVNDLWDVQAVFHMLVRLSHLRTRLIMNFYSRIWELPLKLAQRVGMAMPTPLQNWLTVEDIRNLLDLEDFETLFTHSEVLCPLSVPFLSGLANRILVKVWPFSAFALTNFVVARPKPRKREDSSAVTVSVIIPARNEAGNISQILNRMPAMGSRTELIFVEGSSEDNTFETIETLLSSDERRNCRLLKQQGKGKGDAVRLGFEQASGDVLMILDADLSVPPEALPRFLMALCTGTGDFINGVRLVYPMESNAMRFMNLLGNKFFSMAFSWLLGQSIKDTLCGTKALWKKDYERIAANRFNFGDFDPFGDFDLIFGAVKQNLKIVDLPVRYRSRTYGYTNIERWKHGWMLFTMMCFAALKIKFK
jgi:ubiquinone/menaquinone biosynthesis C-methylase UbiE